MSRQTATLAVFVVLLLGVGAAFWWSNEAAPAPDAGRAGVAGAPNVGATTGELAPVSAANGAAADAAGREQVSVGTADTGVRGIVLDAATGRPLGGVEVIALAEEPSIEPLLARFRGLFRGELFVAAPPAPPELGRTVSRDDGTFELRGLRPGRVFLDGRSDGWFVRTPGTTRLAVGEMKDGIELRASPGGRVRGIVLGTDGGPTAGATVTLRPGPNAFLGQLTERQFRWRTAVTDGQGRFDMPGVPLGQGYVVSAAAPALALEEQFGVEVRSGQVTEVTIQGHQGGVVAGIVVDAQGAPVVGANVALVYLDISRVLFSADGRQEPIVTDDTGHFRIEHVASGRVAFVAAAQDLAPSRIQELAIVDGGVYDDVVLALGEGATVRGRVVDDQQQPVANATVELQPFERPDDPQFLKMVLKVRRIAATTAADGTFVAKGLTGERLIVQAQKAGYTTAMKFGVKLDEPEVLVVLKRGAIVRGKVTLAGAPVARFRVDTRSEELPARDGKTDGKTDGAPANGAPNGTAEASGPRQRGNRRPGFRFGGGPPEMREGTVWLPEGQTMIDRGLEGNWTEVQSADGSFELRGIPPGHVRVRVRADGLLDAESREVDLAPGQTSDVLAFELRGGEAVGGRVVDAATGQPVSDAQVTAYKQRDDGQRRGPFNFQIDAEDFDFLALSSAENRRSALSDSKGHFMLPPLEPGRYRFTARHPDLAKSSAKDVEVVAGKPTPDVEIQLAAGGGVEGTVTGFGMRPLADALVVAFSIQAGAMRSGTTDKGGFFRIDGLSPGQYVVFKSRLDERADNIPLELMSNMRLKSVTVREGKFTRVDVQDDSEDGVRVFGVVREGATPVPRALVTLLGSDREGLLGMGVRAGAAGMDGRYELIGIKPGNYVMQVSRFQGQPVQTTFEIEVPEGAHEFAFDVVLPTSEVAGRVVDTRGNPVAGVQVRLGSDSGALAGADGLIGLIAQNGLSQARTDDDGAFRMRSVAAGTYRLQAGNRFGPRQRGNADGDGEAPSYGEATLEGVVVDGSTPVEGLVVTMPLAGRITGLVVDGSGNPVAGTEIAYVETSQKRRRTKGNPLLDLLGAQSQPIRSDAQGRFEIKGLTPGVYDLRVEGDALQAGRQDDVQVAEDAAVEVTLHMVRGATLRVRATNVDKQQIPFAQVSLLDGRGKPVVSRVSTLTVMKRLMNRDEVADSGWYEFGSVPPDTYTAVLAEPGKPEVRITRVIADGEVVEWDVDVAAELAARDGKK